MTPDIVIKLDSIAKSYRLYKNKKDRMKEALHPAGKKYHRDFFALKDINLAVKKGEILGIMGKNGAGKSTLLQIISDVLTPTSGTKWTKGTVIPLLDLGAGFNPEFTGMQNIYFKAALQGLDKKAVDKQLDAILAFADIGEFVHQPVRVYSSGMKARLGFAVSVNIAPDILVVDEVLAVGDEFFKRKCYMKMQQLMQSGCTVIYVSHSRNNIVQICTRAVLLDGGELILDGAPLQVTRYYQALMYASADSYDVVRQEILELKSGIAPSRDFSVAEEQGPAAAGSPDMFLDEEADSMIEPFLLTGFRSRTVVIKKYFDVDIIEPRMETLTGENVNSLVMHEQYVFSFQVKFGLDLECVQFAAAFQNIKGITISGLVLPGKNDGQTIAIKKGETYEIKNRFRCILVPGIYYISAFVFTADPGAGRLPVSQAHDLFVCKVLNGGRPFFRGMVEMEQEGEICRIAE